MFILLRHMSIGELAYSLILLEASETLMVIYYKLHL